MTNILLKAVKVLHRVKSLYSFLWTIDFWKTSLFPLSFYFRQLVHLFDKISLALPTAAELSRIEDKYDLYRNGVEIEKMPEKKFDDMLQIRTIGLREWRGKKADDYSRYEATPYEALEKLFQSYKLKPTDSVVDFGSGRGRVSFYIHHHYNVPVTGVENNDLTFDEALKNEAVYKRHNEHLSAPITFEYGLAENYEIQPEDNVFYFFNPFSLAIFKQVVHNILQSLKEEKRQMDIILYYPLPEFKQFLKNETPFRLMNKIKAYSGHGKYGIFAVYRYDEAAEG